MWRAVVLMLLTFCSVAHAEEIRLTHPLGDAYLLTPERCEPACPLLIVSHSRGMTAAESLTHPNLARFFGRFVEGGFAVLVSNDAGGDTWGKPAALLYLEQVRARAVRLFAFSGRSYALGYSMGGLPALLSAYKGLFPVAGVLLLDARVNLLNAWQAQDRRRREDIAAALDVSSRAPLPHGADPLHDYPAENDLPLFVAGSPQDQTVPFAENGEALFGRSGAREKQLLWLSGPHLGESHFGGRVADEMLAFLNRLEHLDRAEVRRETPALP